MDAVLYEKCAHCWHFIEPNYDWDEDHSLAEYLHLDNGEKEHDHDAEPSGDIRTLDEWKRVQPSLFHTFPDGNIGPNSMHFIPEYATAWQYADDCDTCWYLSGAGLDAEDALGEDEARAKLRAHIASGHKLTSEEC